MVTAEDKILDFVFGVLRVGAVNRVWSGELLNFSGDMLTVLVISPKTDLAPFFGVRGIVRSESEYFMSEFLINSTSGKLKVLYIKLLMNEESIIL